MYKSIILKLINYNISIKVLYNIMNIYIYKIVYIIYRDNIMLYGNTNIFYI